MSRHFLIPLMGWSTLLVTGLASCENTNANPSSTPAAASPAAGAAATPSASSTATAATPTPQSPATPAAAKSDDPLAPPPDVAGPPPDAQKTATGLASKVLRPGTGTKNPAPEDLVTVHYTGWTTDGKMFDSSVKRGEPTQFPLNRVIPGWTQGVALMVVGEKRRLWIPQDLAYKGRPGPPAGMLVFDVELVDFKEGPKPIAAPSDVAEPPKDAQKTASGLASKVLQAGTGTAKPTATSEVQVHYTGWTTDGKMFDSSLMRGQPARFPLNRVIPGWTEGVALMVEGEKRRFWIPVEMAYRNQPGKPAGMLVFDVELLKILGP